MMNELTNHETQEAANAMADIVKRLQPALKVVADIFKGLAPPVESDDPRSNTEQRVATALGISPDVLRAAEQRFGEAAECARAQADAAILTAARAFNDQFDKWCAVEMQRELDRIEREARKRMMEQASLADHSRSMCYDTEYHSSLPRRHRKWLERLTGDGRPSRCRVLRDARRHELYTDYLRRLS